ncbi:MAG: tetratricopeptide repeat protein [Verrucomicrobia bacterium]|nr:tetratricopeptide repeat protein [Verrucomicrobiota bacterium]
MSFGAGMFALLGFVAVVAFYWQRLFEANAAQARRWLFIWMAKGVAAPAVVWVFLNLGVSSRFPPLMGEIEAAKSSGGNWLEVLLNVTGPVLWTIGSLWAAMTMIWLVMSLLGTTEQRAENFTALLGWSCLSLPVATVTFWLTGWPGTGLAVVVWLAPAVHNMVAPLADSPPAPNYTRALVNLKFGKWNQAEKEVISELEKCQDDFNGWMMLAEMYALHFDDLPAAEDTVRDVCAQPNVTPSDVSVALHRLADWHLKLGADPVAARRALEEIGRRFPGSHLDKMARLRLNQLPASKEQLLEQRRGKVFRLPVLNDEIETPSKPREPAMTQEAAAARANQCVEKLKKNPNDVAAREDFAKLLAEQLAKPDLAVEQLELLLDLPNQPPIKRAEWLSVLAAWHFKYRGDADAARKLLERLISQYPQTPQAFAAQGRLNLIRLQERMRQGRGAVAKTAISEI